MAEYKFGCPQCGQHIQCTDAYIGKQINCPTCQKAIIVARPKGAAPTAAPQPAPVERTSSSSILRIAVIAAIACGLCGGLVIGGFIYFSQQRAQQKELQRAQQKAKTTAVKKPAPAKAAQPKKIETATAEPTTNSITASMLTLVNGSTLQVSLDVGSASAPASMSVQSPNQETMNLDVKSLTSVNGQTLSLARTLTGFGNTTINVTGSRTDTLALGAIVGMTTNHNPYFNFAVNTVPDGPRLTISSFQSGNWGEWLNLQGGGKVTITGDLTNISGGSSIVYITDGTTATLQGVSAVFKRAADAYKYDVANGTLVLDNGNAVTNNTTSVGIGTSWFILGAATNIFSVARRCAPPPGVLIAADNSYNAAIYLGDADYATGGIVNNAKNTNYVSDGDVGFENTGTFTIGGQNTSGINAYANPIILGRMPNKGKSVTLVAATGGEVDFTGGLLANGSDKTAGVTVGDSAHGGIVKFTAANTYGGNTFVSNGTLALSGNGAIANSANIVLAAGATFDVSDLSSTFTLGSSQTLSNSASTGSINGNVNTSLGVVSLTYDSAAPSLTVANGTLNLANNTVFQVNNTGPALAAGSYKIISKQTGGMVSTTTTLPAVNVGGGGIAAGATASLQIKDGELYLVVTTANAGNAAGSANTYATMR